MPSAVVWVTLGLKISAPHAFGAAIFGEILAGYSGIGVLIRTAGSTFDAGGLFAATFVAASMAIALNAVVGRLAQRMLRWRETGAGATRSR
jgi:NitT/TauT family transport system permease protein